MTIVTSIQADIELIAFDKLVPSAANVRKAQSTAKLSELAESIASHGLIQNLTVRKGAKGKYEVVAGARRLAAMGLLVKDGRMSKSDLIPCRIQSDHSDTEISLAENIMREKMHPVDEVRAFADLTEQGMPPEEIAARFGMSHMTVRRRLKLAHLSPRILDEMREDKLSLEQAEALALSDDHAEQERAWFDAGAAWARSPESIRSSLTREDVNATHHLARFVGVEAYEAAGGTVKRDLFSERNNTFLTDRELLNTLAHDKLAEIANAYKANGWSWAHIDLEGNLYYSSHFNCLLKVEREMTVEEIAEALKLAAEYDELSTIIEAGSGDDDELQAAEDRIEEIVERQSDLESARSVYDREDMKLAGCIFSVNPSGVPHVREGLVTAADWKLYQARKAGSEGNEQSNDDIDRNDQTDKNDQNDKNDKAVVPAVLIEELTAIRTAALRVELAKNHVTALAAVLHPMLMQKFYANIYGGVSVDSAVELRTERKDFTPCIQKPADFRAVAEWDALTTSTQEALPANAADLWDWLIGQTQEKLLELLAYAAAANVNAIQYRHDTRKSGRIFQADQIAKEIKFDIRNWWSPNEKFLERLSKNSLGEILRSQGSSEESIASMQKLPKYEAVIRTEGEILGTDYLPACLVLEGLSDDTI